MTKPNTSPLEDELGDVLEKALRRSGLSETEVAARAGVPLGKLLDAIDYRPELNCDELRRLAAALALNEVGLCALGTGKYPQPAIAPLPFRVWPLQMPHGIGVTNAFLVGETGTGRALLFDTGAGIDALTTQWPPEVGALDAVFLTHVEAEHAGGLCEVVARFGAPAAFIPATATAPCGAPLTDGETRRFGGLEVTAFATPGHSAAHSCYLVRASANAEAPALLIAGDLVFAGSVGGAYFCHRRLAASLRRILGMVPGNTVIAPGHGPLTTVEHELRFNPFLG